MSLLKNLKPTSRDDALIDDPLREFHVWWDDITYQDLELLRQTLESASGERILQRFFEKTPLFLVQHLGGGHGRWCIPQKRLGAEYIPDFVIGERNSMGLHWYGIELESPKVKLFNNNGDPSRFLNHAIRQITDWRVWLTNNIDYARRLKDQGGLGLTDIDGNIPGVVLIGRRNNLNSDTRDRRRQMCKDNNVKIHTYDWLLEQAEHRCNVVQKKHRNI